MGAGAVAAGGAALVGVGRLASRRRGSSGSSDGTGPAETRWQSVTVVLPPDLAAPGGILPEPLTRLGDAIETRVTAAPGSRGTEIAARLTRPVPTGLRGAVARARNDDPRQDLRSALREAKQLIEVGEVLVVDPAPHGRRGLIGTALIGTATRRAGREGVL